MSRKIKYYFMYVNAIISSFAVVVLHTVANPQSFGVNMDRISFYPIIFILIGILFSFGVPIFFMQSGANILSYRERYDTKTYFIKRIHKVIVPFIIWSIFGFLFLHNPQLGGYDLLSFFRGFISGSIVGPYWFFYNIIGFYLCVPFISIIIEKGSTRLIKYIIVIALIYNTVLPIIDLVCGISNMFNPSIPFIGAYLQYFLAGWYFVNVPIKKQARNVIYIMAVIMLLFEIFATIYFSIFVHHNNKLIYPGGIVKNFADISNLPAFICMCALFLLTKQLEPQISKFQFLDKLSLLAGLTFGIYLIHPFIIKYVLNPIQPVLLQVPLFIKIVVYPLSVYIISGVITYFVRKIPYVHNIMP